MEKIMQGRMDRGFERYQEEYEKQAFDLFSSLSSR